MSEWIAFLFATVTGFVAAGFIGSFYRLVMNRPVSFQLAPGSVFVQFIEVLILIFVGPTVILRNALRAQAFENRPPMWLVFSAVLAMMWSFLSGVVLLGTLMPM